MQQQLENERAAMKAQMEAELAQRLATQGVAEEALTSGHQSIHEGRNLESTNGNQ
jgi:hypothetical protein